MSVSLWTIDFQFPTKRPASAAQAGASSRERKTRSRSPHRRFHAPSPTDSEEPGSVSALEGLSNATGHHSGSFNSLLFRRSLRPTFKEACDGEEGGETISLWEALSGGAGPAEASGRRHPLAAVLTLARWRCCRGRRSLYAIAQFGRDREAGGVRARRWGSRGRVPDAVLRDAVLPVRGRWTARRSRRRSAAGRGGGARGGVGGGAPGRQGAAGHPGARGAGGPPAGGVRPRGEGGAGAGPGGRQDQRAQGGAGTAGPAAAGPKGKVVTGDAMFCQRDLSKEVVKKGAHYLWPVKDNQPDLLAAIADAFDDEGVSPRERKLAEAERQAAASVGKGHGRLEKRTLTSTTALRAGRPRAVPGLAAPGPVLQTGAGADGQAARPRPRPPTASPPSPARRPTPTGS